MSMDIAVGVGLGGLIFGMAMVDVIRVVGEPDKALDIEETGTVEYFFNSAMLTVRFSEEDGDRMSSIEVFDPEVRLFNTRLIGRRRQEILNILRAHGCAYLEDEDYDSFQTVFCETIWSTFYFEFDRLRSVLFGPLFNQDGEFIWPPTARMPELLPPDLVTPPEPATRPAATMEVKIGLGLDDLLFGMSPGDVTAIMGRPDRIYETEAPDATVYDFNGPMIKTKHLNNENGRMYSIEVFNPNARMLDEMVIGKNKDVLLGLLRLNGCRDLVDIVQYDYGSFDAVFCESIYCTLEFQFDRLIGIEFSPLLDKNDEPIWPHPSGKHLRRPVWN